MCVLGGGVLARVHTCAGEKPPLMLFVACFGATNHVTVSLTSLGSAQASSSLVLQCCPKELSAARAEFCICAVEYDSHQLLVLRSP